jgi:outer membrane protein OmpA-like peptidoglycan-associated protein
MHSEDSNLDGMSSQDSHWIPLSDLMTGLMVMFLLIAVTYITRVEAETARIKEVAVAYNEIRDSLYHDLQLEFGADLPRWRAELVRSDLSIRFTDPGILFANGSSDLKPQFRDILEEFFPRYERLLASPKYRGSITEIRIEGHTSSEWTTLTSADDAYFKNMDLSQARTRSALTFVLSLPSVAQDRLWLKRLVTANGLSSSQPILDGNQNEDLARSRRVVFRVRTDAEDRIARILEVAR